MRKSDAPSKVGLELLQMVIETTSELYLTLEIPASVPVLDQLENDRSGQHRELKNVVFCLSIYHGGAHLKEGRAKLMRLS